MVQDGWEYHSLHRAASGTCLTLTGWGSMEWLWLCELVKGPKVEGGTAAR